MGAHLVSIKGIKINWNFIVKLTYANILQRRFIDDPSDRIVFTVESAESDGITKPFYKKLVFGQ